MAEIEIWQGTADTRPYRYMVRDAEPPRLWYGVQEDGQGGWRFQPLADATLVELDDFSPLGDEAQARPILQAFRERVTGESA